MRRSSLNYRAIAVSFRISRFVCVAAVCVGFVRLKMKVSVVS